VGTLGRPDGQCDAVMRPTRADIPWTFFSATPSLYREGSFFMPSNLKIAPCVCRKLDSAILMVKAAKDRS
jgi:hypothetical protein